MTDFQLYPQRASRRMPPGMNTKRFMEGFDHANTMVNVFIGVANEVARIAIADAQDVLKKSRHYRHQVKHWSRETFRRQEAYESRHSRNLGERTQMWMDYLDAVQDEYQQHIFNVYMSLKQAMDRTRQSESHLKAKLECGRVCAMLAVSQFDALMEGERQRFGVDYTSFFHPARYDGPLQTWTLICDRLLKDEHPETPTSLRDDKNCQLAFDILARKLNDETLLNRVGAVAIHLNIDVARKYAKAEEVEELEKDFLSEE